MRAERDGQVYSKIPDQGKIAIINNQEVIDRKLVIDKYAKLKKLQTNNIENRGWLLDVLSCTNAIPDTDFSLEEMYQYKGKNKTAITNFA